MIGSSLNLYRRLFIKPAFAILLERAHRIRRDALIERDRSGGLRGVITLRAELEPLLGKEAPAHARAVTQVANRRRGQREIRPIGILEPVRPGLSDIEAEASAIAFELHIEEVDALIQLAAKMRERSHEASLAEHRDEHSRKRLHHLFSMDGHGSLRDAWTDAIGSPQRERVDDHCPQ